MTILNKVIRGLVIGGFVVSILASFSPAYAATLPGVPWTSTDMITSPNGGDLARGNSGNPATVPTMTIAWKTGNGYFPADSTAKATILVFTDRQRELVDTDSDLTQ